MITQCEITLGKITKSRYQKCYTPVSDNIEKNTQGKVKESKITYGKADL